MHDDRDIGGTTRLLSLSFKIKKYLKKLPKKTHYISRSVIDLDTRIYLSADALYLHP